MHILPYPIMTITTHNMDDGVIMNMGMMDVEEQGSCDSVKIGDSRICDKQVKQVLLTIYSVHL